MLEDVLQDYLLQASRLQLCKWFFVKRPENCPAHTLVHLLYVSNQIYVWIEKAPSTIEPLLDSDVTTYSFFNILVDYLKKKKTLSLYW